MDNSCINNAKRRPSGVARMALRAEYVYPELGRESYHFRRAEVLPGNVSYIKFDMIRDDKEALEIAAEALDSLARRSARM